MEISLRDKKEKVKHNILSILHKKYGVTDTDMRKVNRTPSVLEAMVATMRQHPAFRLIHGRFTPLADKLQVVKTWPDINPADVDTAFALATENGTIAGYNAEVGKNVHLDAVVTCYRESLPATLLYGRDRMKDTWGDKYSEWTEAYAQGVDEKRVQAIPGAKPFVPNRVVIEVVDFGANWNKRDGTKLKDVQKAFRDDFLDELPPHAVDLSKPVLSALRRPKTFMDPDSAATFYATADFKAFLDLCSRNLPQGSVKSIHLAVWRLLDHYVADAGEGHVAIAATAAKARLPRIPPASRPAFGAPPGSAGASEGGMTGAGLASASTGTGVSEAIAGKARVDVERIAEMEAFWQFMKTTRRTLKPGSLRRP